MDAESLLAQRFALDERSFVELVIWRLNEPVVGCTHNLKYRLAYVVDVPASLDTTTRRGKVIIGTLAVVNGHTDSVAWMFLQVDFWADVSGLSCAILPCNSKVWPG